MPRRITTLVTSGVLATVVVFLITATAKASAESAIYAQAKQEPKIAQLVIAKSLAKVAEVQKVEATDVPTELLKVAYCESNNRQFKDDGSVVIGAATKDIGRFQINPIHLGDAKKMGVSLYTSEGNRAYALMLYKRNGLRDWSSSKHCWTSAFALKEKGYPG